MKKNTLIFTHGGGRFGNQLLNFAHFYSFWLEYKHEFDLINMGFWPFSNLLDLTLENPACVFSDSGSKHNSYIYLNRLFNGALKTNRRYLNQFLRLIHLYYSLIPNAESILKGESPNYLKYLTGKTMQDLKLEFTESYDVLKRNPKIAVAGWPIRNWKLFEKYKDTVKKDMQFNKKYQEIAFDYISNIRLEYDFLVGVFIRRGDYKYWFDGRYFFSISFYKRIMKEITELYKEKKVCFVIASDDLQEIHNFDKMNVRLTTGSVSMGGHFVESLSELSLCDLIISPPSTFSIWASFIGQKPLLPLISEEQNFSASDMIMNNIFDALIHPHLSHSIK